MTKKYNVAVVGATGVVGQEMLKVLEERNFPVGKIIPLASSRTAGSRVEFQGQEVVVQELRAGSFQDVQLALFSAGSAVSEKYAPLAARAGAVVIDNTAFFRMDPQVPLVVPEINAAAVHQRPKGIIANPNCSTAQMVVALKPIYDAAGIKRLVISTYQAVSGTGKEAIDELEKEVLDILQLKKVQPVVYPHQIAFNILPHIDDFLADGYTKEEMKMVNETKKIFGDDSIRATATTCRVPVFYGHSECVNVETRQKLTADEARRLLRQAANVVVLDEPQKNIYPMPILAAGKNETLVGRIREDISVENGLELFIVADNLRKGAAFNAVQIAEEVIKDY
ncbi:aspartate-semialdehyde dehydrogenase [Candidatus Termititenax persephonae]|uniref:Aspartate-semialdehyde dehydrogenase n=1 Tax=Candidatus Termititenax persephonae TaxID=2218525 RepID=A0A388THZ1_9BACT|nr:aspartate-semialdehyde dehydrogenase [Candidatus Termititenax persephonae]